MSEWFREAFQKDWLRAATPFLTPERNARDVASAARLLERAGVLPGARLADLPCGFGRISRPLAERGYRVTGLDLAWDQVAAARDGAPPPSLSLVRGDLRALPFADERFDAALTLDVSVGYGTLEEDRRILAEIARTLRPGGALLFEQNHREGTLAGMRASAFHERDGVRVHVACAFDEATARYSQRVAWGDGARSGVTTILFRLYTADELRALLQGAGFAIEAEFAGLASLQPLAAYLPRYLALATKGRGTA